MDQVLVDIMLADSNGSKESPTFRYVNEEPGEIEIETADGAKRHLLKPLAELFSKGADVSSIDWKDQRFMPLLHCIEIEILNHDGATPGLSDGLVALTLDRMALNPATAPADDPLCRRLQLGLRVLLSLNDYTKQEVKLAVRKIAKSVKLHTWHAGNRGYLDFIRQQFGG